MNDEAASMGGLAPSLRTILAIIMRFAGQDPDSFNLQNPAPTRGGFYLSPGGSPFLYSIATSFDRMMFWALFLTALGLSIISKKLKTLDCDDRRIRMVCALPDRFGRPGGCLLVKGRAHNRSQTIKGAWGALSRLKT